MLEAVGLRQWFDAVVAAEDVSVGKPDPEVFLRAAAMVGVPPGRCVVVEDAPHGVEGARRAGMASIGVGPGNSLPASVSVERLDATAVRRFRAPAMPLKWKTPARRGGRTGVR